MLTASYPGGKVFVKDTRVSSPINRRMTTINAGLEGVVAAATALSHVDGERGELIVGGFPIGELAGSATFEETTWLLWYGDLPTAAELAGFRAALARHRALP